MTEPDVSDGTVGPVDGAAGPLRGASAVVPAHSDSEGLLDGVEQDLELLEELDTGEQVPVFDRLHTSLADALAKTADTGHSPGAQGRPGA